jgi:hypothetical protein
VTHVARHVVQGVDAVAVLLVDAVVEAANATAGTLRPIVVTRATTARDLVAMLFISSPFIRTDVTVEKRTVRAM